MEGNSNSATLIEDRPVSLRTKRHRHVPLRGSADVDALDFARWDEQPDEFHKIQSPLSVAGFVRLGGLNPSTSTARKNGKHRGSSQHADDDVILLAHGKSTFRPTESTVGERLETGLVRESAAPTAATSAFTSTIPGTGRNTVSGTIEEDSAPELNARANADPSPTAPKQHPFQQLQDLSKRVKAGDESAIAEIQRILDSNDTLWRHLGDVEKNTEAMLIEFAAGTADIKESVRRSVAAMKQSLLGEQPTPLERMAVGRVVACWLFAHFIDRWCGWSVKQGGRASDLAKLLEASEKRYQISLRSLKLVQEI